MCPEKFQIFFIAYSCKKQCIQKSYKYSLFLLLQKVVYPERFQISFIACSCEKQCIQKSLKYSLLLTVVKSSVSGKVSNVLKLLIVVKSSVSKKVPNILYCLQLEIVVYPERFQIFLIAYSCKKRCIQKRSKHSLLLVVVNSSASRNVLNILYCLQL